MSNYAKEVQPERMVEYQLTFKVVILGVDGIPAFRSELMREALIAAMPTGTGVGHVTCVVDGPIMSEVKK